MNTEHRDATRTRVATTVGSPGTRRQGARRRALIGAGLVALGCGGMVWEIARLRAARPQVETGRYLAARGALAAGERLSDDFLEEVALPLDAAHPKAVPATARDLVAGRELRDGVGAGEVLLWNALAGNDAAEARLGSLVRKGERAVAIAVDGIASVGYFVLPGDRVDLFLGARQHGQQVVVPVLQNVSVLAVGQATPGQPAPETYGRVVVSVTPPEAELLLLAQQTGKIYLLLRHADDLDADADFPVLREAEFLGSDLRKNVQQQRNARAVRIVRGAG